MTFEEWFEVRFPTIAPSMGALRESYREIAGEAWDAGFQSGQDHQRELERLAEYDRNSFMFDYR